MHRDNGNVRTINKTEKNQIRPAANELQPVSLSSDPSTVMLSTTPSSAWTTLVIELVLINGSNQILDLKLD